MSDVQQQLKAYGWLVTRLARLVGTLDRAEALRRASHADFLLLGLLEDRMSPPLHEVYAACKRHWPNKLPPETAEKYDAEILMPAWRHGWSLVDGWRYSANFYIVAMLTAVVGIPGSWEADETADLASSLEQLGLPVERLTEIYQTVYPELKVSDQN
jgi:hypothetical protein